MSRYTSPAKALENAGHLTAVCRNLLSIAAEDITVEIGTTARMRGDYLDAVQDQTLSVYKRGNEAAEYPDEYYVCGDAGQVGGPTTYTTAGNCYVAADYVDGVHRLDVSSGELIDSEVLL